MPAHILTVNGGSSSIKLGWYAIESDSERRIARQNIERLDPRDHPTAAGKLLEGVDSLLRGATPVAIGHRIVHGGLRLLDHAIIDTQLIDELKRSVPLDLAHLPREIALVEALVDRFADVPQIACFDTAFHKELPRVAQLLPIPRQLLDSGIRRFGFHGLSYTYLMQELRRIAPDAANGRVILAHLGAGASLAAVSNGKPVDTSMAFTPTAGLVMGTRTGDMDPGLLIHLMQRAGKSTHEMDEFVNRECGMLGVSGTSADMRDLLARATSDPRAADAIDLFCYTARKWIGAFAAALGGLDALVFSAGLGENAALVRARICQNLEYLGLQLHPLRNANNDAIISTDERGVSVRVIHTDEESVIATIARRLIESA